MDINKYILGQIKIDEKLMKMVDIQENTPTKVIKKDPKQQPNSFLLNKINEDIKNQSRLNNHYKSIATGKPVIDEDDNIRLINSNQSLDSNLENQFNFLMSKYVKDQTTLTTLLNNLPPNMLAELVHNFGYYESEIRKYKGQYIDDKVFTDKLRNMLLKNVNLKYPATTSLNSAMDSSNDPDIVMQKAFEAKNRAVEEPIADTDKTISNNGQMIDTIIQYIGKTSPICSKIFELSNIVIELVSKYKFITRFSQLEKMLTELSKNDPKSFGLLYAEIESIYTGEIYETKNAEINAFINNIKKQSESFRTFLINFAMEDYNRKITAVTNQEVFYNTFRDYFKNKLNISLDKKKLKIEKFHELSNSQIIEVIDEILPATVGDMVVVRDMATPRDMSNVGDMSSVGYTSTVSDSKEGHGLKPTEKQIHKKYFIDTHKLNNNVLEIRYNKNRHLTNVKSQVIGNGVKQIIHNILNNDSLNEKDYHVLTEHEKHLIRSILNMLEKSHLLSNADEQFNDKFQILLGEYNAGNNSEMLRNQLKQYIIHAMKLNMIGRQAGQQMLIEMSL